MKNIKLYFDTYGYGPLRTFVAYVCIKLQILNNYFEIQLSTKSFKVINDFQFCTSNLKLSYYVK